MTISEWCWRNCIPDAYSTASQGYLYTFIAVLLSAQCTDERVNQITPTLGSKADNPQDMIELGEDAIREIIRPWWTIAYEGKIIYNFQR